jgi:uncharacterized membrane protein
MKRYVAAYVVTAIVFLGIDAIWLTLSADRLYKPNLSKLLAAQFSLAPAALFYAFYVTGIVIFAVAPAFKSGHWTTATLYGALFGLFAYATYDLTNQATLKDWPVVVTIADLCWGTILTAVAATCGYLATRSL